MYVPLRPALVAYIPDKARTLLRQEHVSAIDQGSWLSRRIDTTAIAATPMTPPMNTPTTTLRICNAMLCPCEASVAFSNQGLVRPIGKLGIPTGLKCLTFEDGETCVSESLGDCVHNMSFRLEYSPVAGLRECDWCYPCLHAVQRRHEAVKTFVHCVVILKECTIITNEVHVVNNALQVCCTPQRYHVN